jgi:AcrR family transcriptional regulator
MDAAVRCVQRFGFERTSVGDIAAEAGVTRPTVYAYFKNGRTELLQAAMLHAAHDLVERLRDYVEQFDDPAEQVVENLLFCLREFSSYPSLALLLVPSGSDLGSSSLMPRGLGIARRGLEPLLERCPWLRDDADEIAEVMVRFFLSLLTLEHPRPRSQAEQKAFLHRRLVPALQLDRGRKKDARRGSGATTHVA